MESNKQRYDVCLSNFLLLPKYGLKLCALSKFCLSQSRQVGPRRVIGRKTANIFVLCRERKTQNSKTKAF